MINETQMLYVILIAVLIIGIYGAYYVISKHLEKHSKKVGQIKDILEAHGKLYEEGLFYEYSFQDEVYNLMIIKVQQSAKFTFNSKTIWEKRFGQKKFYTDQTIFSKMPHKKIVIIYPHLGPYMYHYDENEIRFTNPKERIWNMHIIPANDLESVLKEGFK